MLIKVGFIDKNGRKQFATYTNCTPDEVARIVGKERKRKGVVSIQVGSAYVLGGP